ncbi:MAG: hypothetical protein HEQ32_03415 [Vampirovibrio sp.]
MTLNRLILILVLCCAGHYSTVYGMDEAQYDETRWGNDPYSTYNIVPNLEKTAPKETDPYFGPPGHLKNRPTPLPPLQKGLAGKVFGKREAPAPKVPDEVIMQVGPRDYPASPEPLLRLETALVTPEGATLYAGVYLVHSYGLQINASGAILQPPTHLSLSYRGVLCLTLPLTALERDGSPLESLPSLKDPQAPLDVQAPYRQIKIQPIDQDRVCLRYQVGDKTFVTPPIQKYPSF